MQNKGVVKLFAILFGLVSIYQLSFTFVNNNIEKTAKEIAANKFPEGEADYNSKRNLLEQNYLDSLSTYKIVEGEDSKHIEVFDIGITDFTYNEVKDRAMNLGLDLKGGINVILQVSVRDILLGLSNNSTDPLFNQALNQAEELQKNSQDSYLESFYTAFDAIKGDTKLASPDIFANRTLSNEITFDMSDNQVKPIIERKIDESIVSAFEVLRKRIDKFGVTSPNIQRIGNSGRILLELPGAKDIERVRNLITRTAQLQFWDAYKAEEIAPFLAQANESLKSIVKDEATVTEADSTVVATDDKETIIDDLLGETAADSIVAPTIVNPLFDLFKGGGQTGQPIIGLFDKKDKQTVTDYLNKPQIKSLLPVEQRYVKFLWGQEAEDNDFVELYALKGNRDDTPELGGDVVTDASQQYEPSGQPNVSMQMNTKGAKAWEEMTTRAYNQQSQIAIVLDDIVYSAPGCPNGPIAGGNSSISGNFNLNDAVDLANVLRAGKLPATASIVQAEEVGPSLGREAIKSGTISFIIALILVLIWMMFYYGKAGIFSNMALLLNILLIFGILAGLGAVLTLPGIAGIVLTIGIAVDANVLIYERIREELANGKGLKQSIKDGYSNALSSILDANITTGLTALILFSFGTGPIKGFATTLLIGIATSLFTAIYISRLLIEWYVNRGGKLDFATALTKNLFRNIKINWLSKVKLTYTLSFAIILTGAISL